jgi:hypothetical protein
MLDFSDIVVFFILLSDKKNSGQMLEFCHIFSKKQIFVRFLIVLDFFYWIRMIFKLAKWVDFSLSD